MLDVRLAHSPEAESFADRYDPYGYIDNNGSPHAIPCQTVSRQDAMVTNKEQKILVVGSWLLALLAIASVAILVGGAWPCSTAE